jgi:hypothetical protein
MKERAGMCDYQITEAVDVGGAVSTFAAGAGEGGGATNHGKRAKPSKRNV